jgi:hypothetical protein
MTPDAHNANIAQSIPADRYNSNIAVQDSNHGSGVKSNSIVQGYPGDASPIDQQSLVRQHIQESRLRRNRLRAGKTEILKILKAAVGSGLPRSRHR